MLRTISIKLLVSTQTHDALDAVRYAFANACNAIVPYAKDNRIFNNVKLHHLCYYDIREASKLGSQFTCNAIKAVTGKYKALKLKKYQAVPHIQFRPKSVHYDKKTYTLKNDNTVSLSTLGKRVDAKLIWGKHQKALFDKGLPKEAELIFKNGTWYFNLVVELTIPERSPSNKVMGVDLGENNIAATSTGKLIGGGKLRYDRDRFLAIRRRLQRNGSQSGKQLLKRLSGKEARHVTQVNHQVANAVIAEAIEHNIGVIALEKLTNIRKRIKAGKRVRARLHRWAWYQLQTFIEYKAQAIGIEVVYVNPAYSSKTCNKCGAIATRNKHRLTCSCGNRAHSDLNASQNLAWLGETAVSSRGAVNRPNVAA